VDPDIAGAIEALHLRGFTGAAITRYLESNPLYAARAPSERTVQARIRRLSPVDASGQWRPVQAPSTESRVNQQAVLPVLGFVMVWSDGVRLSLTNREAQWISTIKAACPTIPPNWLYILARRYVIAEANSASTERLDRVLAIAPWHSPESYDEMRQLGIVDAITWDKYFEPGRGWSVI
jgi:hypothetical protein